MSGRTSPSGLAALVVAVACASPCTAQFVIKSNGARLATWNLNDEQISSMAVQDNGTIVIGGLQKMAAEFFVPRVWQIDASGNITSLTLPNVLPLSPRGEVLRVSRNGRWAGGFTQNGAGQQLGAVWDLMSSDAPRIAGTTIANGEQEFVAVSSQVNAVTDDGSAIGQSFLNNGLRIGFAEVQGEAQLLRAIEFLPPPLSNLLPLGASRTGEVIAGYSNVVGSISPVLTQATLWNVSPFPAAQVRADSYSSFVAAVSPNGQFAGGHAVVEANQQLFGQAWIVDQVSGLVTVFLDENSIPLDATVVDLTDDGRVGVLNATDPAGESWLLVNGSLSTLSGLLEFFDFGEHHIDLATSVYLSENTYHFALQSTIDHKAYYLSVPASLLVGTGVPGDFNNDYTVDAADYVVWRKNDGTPDGYNTWRTHFGLMAGSGSLSNKVTAPEPATFGILLAAVLVMYAWSDHQRRRGRHRSAISHRRRALFTRLVSRAPKILS